MRRLFALPGFGRLAVTYGLNELAWFVGTLSLSLLVYRRTGSTLETAAFFVCSQGAPAVVAPILVARLDRGSPRRLLPMLYWSEAVLFGALAWFAHRFLLGPVLGLVVLDGVFAMVARSLAGGARTELLKPVGLVREGASVQSMLFSAAYLIGPLIGGAVAAAGGTVLALLVDCGLFAVMGAALVSRTIPSVIVHEGPERRRLRAALTYVRSCPPVRNLLTLQVISFVLFSIPTPIEVVLSVHVLHAGSAGYGALLTAWGAGAMIGSAIYARRRTAPARRMIGTGAILVAAGFASMGLAPHIAVALAGAVLAGIGNGIGATSVMTELMELPPQSWVALVSGLNQSIGVAAPAIGVALGGGLAAALDVRATFVIAALAALGVVAFVAVMLAPARMTLPDAPSGAVPDALEGIAHSGPVAGRDPLESDEAVVYADVTD